MSTHRRAWKQRAGVVVALVAGALLAVPATPAQAAEITKSDGSVTLDAGRSGKVNVEVAFGPNEDSAKISVTGLPDGVSCTGGCGDIEPGLLGRQVTVTLTLTAVGNAPAANGTPATIRVQGSSRDAALSVTVRAAAPPPPPQVQTVKSVSGKVTIEANGKPVPNATVMLLDSQQRRHQTTSDGDGNFRITGSSQNPIAPGRLELGAGKDGVTNSRAINASAGQSLTGQRISLAIRVEVTPSASPSASEEAVPTEEPTDETTDEAAEATPGQQAANNNEDSGGFGSMLIILLGGLLVAAGVGTIVLLWMRRKNADDDEDAPVGAAAGAVPAARGAYRGADDQTRVVNRVGAGPDPTMAGGGALSDAPTMMHRPVVDDVPPDPYGAPPPSYGPNGQQDWAGNGYGDEAPGGYGAGGYGNASASGGYDGGYGNAPASGGGYGNAPASGGGYGNAPASGGGYGNAPSSGGGYGSRDYGAPAGAAGAAGYPPAPGGGAGYGERYDEPTGRYTGDGTQSYAPPADPYPTSTYQPPADQGQGYGQEPQQYGRAPEPPGGYGGGYDAPAGAGSYDAPNGGGGYAGPNGGGYDAPAPGGGYDAGPQGGYDGYDQRGGYGAGNGYDQPAGGYGQQGGYGQEAPQQRGGGYDDRGYDQGGGYRADPAQAGRSRPDGPGQERGGRRLDWLDD